MRQANSPDRADAQVTQFTKIDFHAQVTHFPKINIKSTETRLLKVDRSKNGRT